MGFLLTDSEKENLIKWDYHVEDNSIVSEYFDPMFKYFSSCVPDSIAPNVLTISGLMCTLYGFYLGHNYFSVNPESISFCIGLLIFAYMVLDAIDGKHARKIGNSSPLGELLDHSCDCIGVVFIMLNMCYILGITDKLTQLYIIQTSQLIFLESHIRAFKEKIVTFGKYTGPGEFLVLAIGLALVRTVIPINLNQFFESISQYCYYVVFIYLLYATSTIRDRKLSISLGITFIQTQINADINSSSVATLTIIGNGLILSIITGDIIIAKMADTGLHRYVPILLSISLLGNFMSIAICCMYYVVVLTEIAHYMKIPLFSVYDRKKN